MPHHDVALLPCGKVLAIVCERKTREGASRRQYHNPFSGDAPNPAGDPPHSVFRATFIPPDHPAIAGRNVGR
jgi:hypothetical protein